MITRWTADPNDPSNTAQQLGVRQACTEVSGAAIKDFMTKYPVANSPSPTARNRQHPPQAYPPPSFAVTSATSSLIRSASVIGQTRVICGV